MIATLDGLHPDLLWYERNGRLYLEQSIFKSNDGRETGINDEDLFLLG